MMTLNGNYNKVQLTMRWAILLLCLLVMTLSSSCLEGCFECDAESNICSACDTNYELTILGGCVHDTIPHCNLYLSQQQCMRCSPTYTLRDNSCHRDYSGCLNNRTSLQCTKCDRGLTLALGACHGSLNCRDYTNRCHQCWQGYDLADSVCVATRSNCMSTHSQTGVCLECQDDYDLVGYRCVAKAAFSPRCQIYDELGRCQICKEGYVLEQTVCLGVQELQYLKEEGGLSNVIRYLIKAREESILLQKQRQKQSADQSSSQIPITTNLVSGEPILSDGPGLQPQTKLPISTFQIQKEGKQVSPAGHIMTEQAYERVQKLINIQCKQFDEERNCLECYPSYYLNSKGTCQRIDPLCKYFNHTAIKCKQCYPGYSLVNSKCIITPTPNNHENCLQYEGGYCKNCYPHYHLRNRLCHPNNPLCQTTNSQGQCVECYPGFTLEERECLPPPDAPSKLDPFCISVQHQECSQCANGYYVHPQTKKCKPLSLQCIRHDIDTGECLQCLPAFVRAEGRCVLKRQNCVEYSRQGCAGCKGGYFLKIGLCYKKDVTCAEYDREGNCGKCVETYYLINGQCVFPALGYDPFCWKYVNSYCTECLPGSYLVNYRCRQIDKSCSRFQIIEKRCLECAGGLTAKGEFCI